MFEGVYSVLPTPFKNGGDIDVESLKRVVDLIVGGGVNGVTALGVTSEVSRLTAKERALVLDTVVKQVDGRVKVIAGASGDGVRACLEYSKEAKSLGAAGVMVSPPRAPKLNTESIVNHYKALANGVGELPIVLQDYPPISGFAMEAGLLARIAKEVPTARTIKLEDPPTPSKTARILAAAGDTKVAILGGLGGVFLIEELLAGTSGVMTGFAFPEVLVKIVSLYKAGKIDEAANAFYPFVPLMRFEFQEEIGMAIRKEVLRRRGALADGSTRAPGPVLDDNTRAALNRVLEWTAAQPCAAFLDIGSVASG